MKELIERRKYQRFAVSDGALAILKPFPIKLGRVMDISKGGIEIRYFDDKAWSNDFSEIAIMMSGGNVRLENLPVKTIADTEMVDDFSSSIEKRKRCMQFGQLSDEQKNLLEKFIEKFGSAARADSRRESA